MRLSEQKSAEIMARFADRGEWAGRGPFYKGMFWPYTAERRERFSLRRTKDDRRLLTIGLTIEIRRADFEAARARHPRSSQAINLLERAFDASAIRLLDELPTDDLPFGRDGTACAFRIHRYLYDSTRAPHAPDLDRLEFVARRLHEAALHSLPGVVLARGRRVLPGLMGYGQGYWMKPEDGGHYDLVDLQPKSETAKDRGRWHSFDLPQTPSLYCDALEQYATKSYAQIDSLGETIREPAVNTAAVLADMATQGMREAIIVWSDGNEFTITDLDPSDSIETLRKRIFGIADNTFHIKLVRPMPEPRPRRRFLVVDGSVIAETSIGETPETADMVSIVDYRRRTGDAELVVCWREDGGEIGLMRTFCATVLDKLVEDRKEWIVDIDLSADGPVLAGVYELFDVDWHGADTCRVMKATLDMQTAYFRPEALCRTQSDQDAEFIQGLLEIVGNPKGAKD